MRLRKNSWAFAATLALLWAGSFVFAQQTASIHGTAVDSNGGPLPGVVIVVESPNLQGTRSVATKGSGEFLLKLLTPGNYTVTATMPGMQTIKVNINLGLGQTSKPRLIMQPEATAEAMVVVASADPVLDTSDVTANFEMEFVDNIAAGRTIAAITALAPGTTIGGPNGYVAISGAQTFENSYLLDGGNIAFDNVRGQASFIVIPDAIQETSVMSGSVSAEFGQFTGGMVNTITKSGGNQFSGVLRSAMRNNDWIARTPLELETALERQDQLEHVDSLSIGGPIIKDRLWFHISGSRWRSSSDGQLVAGIAMTDAQATELGYATGQTAPGVRGITSSRENDKLNLKLTGQIYDGHELVFSYSDETDNGFDSTTRGPLGINAAIDLLVPETHLSANYRGIITPEFNVELLYTEKKSTFLGAQLPEGDLRYTGTLLRDRNTFARFFSPPLQSPDDEHRDAEAITAKASYFLTTDTMGSHDIVFGYTDQTNSRQSNNNQSASNWEFWDVYCLWEGPDDLEPTPIFGGGGDATLPTQLIYWPILNESIGSDFNTKSMFVNDKWTINEKLAFNVGLRYDENNATSEDGKPASNSDNLSPRLAVEYDLNGDGKHKFSGSYAEYTARLNDAGQQASTAGSPSYVVWYYYGAVTENIEDIFSWFEDLYGAGCTSDVLGPAGEEFFAAAPYTNVNLSPDPANVITRVDPNLESPSAAEWRVGYSTRFDKGFVKADVIMRDYQAFYTTQTDPVALGQTPNGNDIRLLTNNDEDYERKYNAIQVQGMYRFTDAFTLSGNYTWSQKYGNFIGETEGQAAISGSTVSWYGEWAEFPNAYPRGYLDGDQRHVARIFAGYDLSTPFGDFNFTATERFESGTAYSAGFTINFRGQEEAYGLPVRGSLGYARPPSTTFYYVGERGGFTAEDMTQTDLGVNYSLNIKKLEFFIELNLYNLFNEHAAPYANNGWYNTNVNSLGVPFNVYTETPQEGVHYEFDPGFGTPVEGDGIFLNSAYQRPRTVTVDVGLRF